MCILLILHILSLLFHQALDQRFSLCAGVKGVYKWRNISLAIQSVGVHERTQLWQPRWFIFTLNQDSWATELLLPSLNAQDSQWLLQGASDLFKFTNFFISGGEIAFPCSARFAKVHALPDPYGKDFRQIFWPVVSRLGLNKQFVPLLHKHRKTILHSSS